jgi:hypothetical protein
MAKRNQLSRGGPGGGAGSRALGKPTTYFTGHPSDRVSTAGVSQVGSAMGNRAMDSGGKVLPNPASSLMAGSFTRPGQPELGNSKALDVGGGGPGKGRVLYGQSGTQAQHGPVAGEPKPVGRGFDSRSTITKV